MAFFQSINNWLLGFGGLLIMFPVISTALLYFLSQYSRRNGLTKSKKIILLILFLVVAVYYYTMLYRVNSKLPFSYIPLLFASIIIARIFIVFFILNYYTFLQQLRDKSKDIVIITTCIIYLILFVTFMSVNFVTNFCLLHPRGLGYLIAFFYNFKRISFSISFFLFSLAVISALVIITKLIVSLRIIESSKVDYQKYLTLWTLIVLSCTGTGVWFWNIDSPARTANYHYVSFRDLALSNYEVADEYNNKFDAEYFNNSKFPEKYEISSNKEYKNKKFYKFNKQELNNNFNQINRIYNEIKKFSPTTPTGNIPYSTYKITSIYRKSYLKRKQALDFIKYNSLDMKNFPDFDFNYYKNYYLVPSDATKQQRFPQYESSTDTLKNSFTPLIGSRIINSKNTDTIIFPKLYFIDSQKEKIDVEKRNQEFMQYNFTG
ncbi:hypothetical protein ACPBEH_03465 [Latilactobacillus sp. 5-91]|uniref:hypothetical protein n=1 Tax=Latilactobacillus sp. 5-91 TaxID=3410924 RepID=UPI003C76B209